MSGADCHYHARLAYIDPAGAVSDGDLAKLPFAPHFADDLDDLVFGHRLVCLVFQLQHPAALVVVPGHPQKNHHRPIDPGGDVISQGCRVKLVSGYEHPVGFGFDRVRATTDRGYERQFVACGNGPIAFHVLAVQGEHDAGPRLRVTRGLFPGRQDCVVDRHAVGDSDVHPPRAGPIVERGEEQHGEICRWVL